MRYAIRTFGAAACLALLTSCGSLHSGTNSERPLAATAIDTTAQNVVDEPVKLGAPYTVAGTTYTPQDTPQYDAVGYAGRYGAELVGRPTANGEIFNPAGASAAHKTLPMPSYVEVTALDTGRTILVRVNDRGPFANDRLIDLSIGAARQLGIGGEGVSGVRVRRVNPPEQEKSMLRQGMIAAERIETPEPLLKVLRDKLAKLPGAAAAVRQAAPIADKTVRDKPPAPSANDRFVREGGDARRPGAATRPAPAAVGDYAAQVGAFSSRARAEILARKIGASVVPSSDGRLFRVRFGPFATAAEAAAMARQRGYPNARVYAD